MSFPPQSDLRVFEQFTLYFNRQDMLEKRFENDGDGNPIYIGYAITPKADPALPVWYIQFLEYDGTGVVRARLPDDGVKFGYVWNDRTDYFTA